MQFVTIYYKLLQVKITYILYRMFRKQNVFLYMKKFHLKHFRFIFAYKTIYMKLLPCQLYQQDETYLVYYVMNLLT